MIELDNLIIAVALAWTILSLTLSALAVCVIASAPWKRWGCKHDYLVDRELPSGNLVFKCAKCGDTKFPN
jgi:hypothetical protein